MSGITINVSEFELDACCSATAEVVIFRNVKNAKELKGLLMSGQLKCCMVKPSLILDPFQIVVAVNKAIISEKEHKMTARNVFTEILYNLSISKNISQSINKFGINEEDKDILLVVIRRNGDSAMDQVMSLVVGDCCSIDQLEFISNIESIKKTYNIKETELEVSSLLDSIVSRISAKDVIAFKM